MTTSPAGLDCRVTAGVADGSSICGAYFKSHDSINATLIATPDPGSQCSIGPYDHWEDGPCSQKQLTWSGICEQPCLPLFADFRLTHWALTVTKSGVGSGTVSSSPAGISCGAACSQTGIAYGTKETLTAAPDKGAVFQTWTGACNGQGATCTLTITGDTSTNAVFGLPTSPPPPPPPPPGGHPPPPGQPPPPPSPPPPPATRDETVDATVLAVKTGRSRLGTRLIRVELAVRERLIVLLQLRRNGKPLATAKMAAAKGDVILPLVIPDTVAKGPVTLKITLTDSAGNSKGARRNVTLPAAVTRERRPSR